MQFVMHAYFTMVMMASSLAREWRDRLVPSQTAMMASSLARRKAIVIRHFLQTQPNETDFADLCGVLGGQAVKHAHSQSWVHRTIYEDTKQAYEQDADMHDAGGGGIGGYYNDLGRSDTRFPLSIQVQFPVPSFLEA